MSIKIEDLVYIYNESLPHETKALNNINLEIENGEYVAIIGHTGSGKSTLIQHLNGLLSPKSGKIFINDMNITEKGVKMSQIRERVGLVFQYPEYQLFEETVAKDVAFGPANIGIKDKELEDRVIHAIGRVGLDYHEIKDKSPFDLSGGQKRRIAIAGVIAMNPEVIILDEPTAGLDPKGHKEIMDMIHNIHEHEKVTIILVSHNMDDVVQYADRVIVLENGKVLLNDKPQEVYKNKEILESVGLGVPSVMELMFKIKEKGIKVNENVISIDEAEIEIERLIRSKLKND